MCASYFIKSNFAVQSKCYAGVVIMANFLKAVLALWQMSRWVLIIKSNANLRASHLARKVGDGFMICGGVSVRNKFVELALLLSRRTSFLWNSTAAAAAFETLPLGLMEVGVCIPLTFHSAVNYLFASRRVHLPLFLFRLTFSK